MKRVGEKGTLQGTPDFLEFEVVNQDCSLFNEILLYANNIICFFTLENLVKSFKNYRDKETC